MKIVNIYTDGACAGNQNEENIGGWGCVLEYQGREKELCGGEMNTTNNRMELTALIEALQALKEPGLELHIFSDSAYLVNCFRSGWHINWQNNGWKNSQKKPVENRELWEKLLELLALHKPTFYLVKGHQTLKEGGEAANSKAFERFIKHNGEGFTFERFAEVVEYNDRCDALANEFINEHRASALQEPGCSKS